MQPWGWFSFFLCLRPIFLSPSLSLSLSLLSLLRIFEASLDQPQMGPSTSASSPHMFTYIKNSGTETAFRHQHLHTFSEVRGVLERSEICRSSPSLIFMLSVTEFDPKQGTISEVYSSRRCFIWSSRMNTLHQELDWSPWWKALGKQVLEVRKPN